MLRKVTLTVGLLGNIFEESFLKNGEWLICFKQFIKAPSFELVYHDCNQIFEEEWQ